MRFHILKPLYNIFIINPMSYISSNVHSQTLIHPLISHLIDLFQIFKDLNGLFQRFLINKFLLSLLSLLIFILFFQILAQIGLLLSFIILFFKGQDIDNMIIFKFILVGLKKYLRSWRSKFFFRG